MTKEDLVNAVAEEVEISKKEAKEAVGAVLDSITAALAKGNKVQLVGFGSFLVRQRKARLGVNPKTGEKIKIKARKVPVFSAGQALKDKVK